MVAIAWKWSIVGQIWSQMKKLIFLKIESANPFHYLTLISHISTMAHCFDY